MVKESKADLRRKLEEDDAATEMVLTEVDEEELLLTLD